MRNSTNSLKRVQILLDEYQHRYLAQQARSKGRSLSSLVRELLERAIQLERANHPDLRMIQQLAALDRLTRLRHSLYRRWGGYATPSVAEDLENMRQERDDELAGLR